MYVTDLRATKVVALNSSQIKEKEKKFEEKEKKEKLLKVKEELSDDDDLNDRMIFNNGKIFNKIYFSYIDAQ